MTRIHSLRRAIERQGKPEAKNSDDHDGHGCSCPPGASGRGYRRPASPALLVTIQLNHLRTFSWALLCKRPQRGRGPLSLACFFPLSFFSRRPSQKSLLLRGWVLLLHEHLFSPFTHPPFLLHIRFNRRRILDLGHANDFPIIFDHSSSLPFSFIWGRQFIISFVISRHTSIPRLARAQKFKSR